MPRIESRYLPVTESGCWLWEGSLNGGNYPSISVNGKNASVTRIMLEHKLGRPIKVAHQANHHCDVPLCINPAHLYEGSQADNERDKVDRGRHPGASQLLCKHGHPLVGENLYRHGNTRHCRVCNRTSVRSYSQRKRAQR
jgi:hypothetical protein